jgi:hypothetical protein
VHHQGFVNARAQDLTESSALGAVLSLISIAIIAALFVAQLKSAFAGMTRADAARADDTSTR